jgi:hypothetical protein
MKFDEQIYYLCRDLNNEWNFPNEMHINHQSLGSFFVLGDIDDYLSLHYKIKYVHNDTMIDADLIQSVNNRNFYVASIPLYGDFIFLFENILKYNWIPSQSVAGLSNNSHLLYRVKPWNIDKFERVCQQHDIYFVGFANV